MRTGLAGTFRHAATQVFRPGTFSRNVTTIVLTQATMLVLSVGSSVITARLLGADGKGIVAIANLVQGILVLVFNFGIGSANVQFAGSRRETVEVLTANSTGFALVVSIVGVSLLTAAGALGWLGSVIPRVPFRYLLIGILGFPINLIGVYWTCILQGLQRISAINRTNLVQGGLTLLLIVGLVLGLRWGIAGALVASITGTAVSLILKGAYLRREGASLRPRWSAASIRKMLGFGLRGYAGNLLQFFNYRLDVFVVNWYLGPAAVGIYSVGVSLAELLWQLPQSAAYVLFPKAAGSSATHMNRFTPRVLAVTLGLTTLGAIGLAILGPWLIPFFFSRRFEGSYAPMLALLPGVILLGGGKILTNDIAGRGYPEYNSITSAIVVVMTVWLTLWLIPTYGIIGASVASTIAYATAFVISLAIYRRVSQRGTSSAEAVVEAR